jgi:hypothetical protein
MLIDAQMCTEMPRNVIKWAYVSTHEHILAYMGTVIKDSKYKF